MSDYGEGLLEDAPEETRNWRLYVEDMIEFAEKVMAYTRGLNQGAFADDSLTYDATLRNLQLIGEAATHVPDKLCLAHPEIEWRSIIGTRNRLALANLGMDDDVIWDIIRTDVPDLLPKLRSLMETARCNDAGS